MLSGSQNTLLRLAGLKALNSIIKEGGYSDFTQLIASNSDYFSFYVIRKLKQYQYSENVLNVLAVVLNNSTIEVFESISEIIKGVRLMGFYKKLGNL